MDFLERFSSRDRERLLATASILRLSKGELLIRRGEPGGDIYRVLEGELEVIDSRSQPVVVLDVIGEGAVVGEMAFLDEAVRSADVRAAEGSVVQRWERPALMRVLEADHAFAASFYRVLAQLVTDRSRAVRTLAATGAFVGGGKGRGENELAARVGERLAHSLRDRLIELEPAIRRDRTAARREVMTALHNFQERAAGELGRLPDEDAALAGERLGRELHPYFIRSHLGEIALDRPSGHLADPAAVAHIHLAEPEGDGPLGEFLDEWLLNLPTARALRERTALLADMIMEHVPPDGALRLLLVNVGAGQLLAALLPHVDRVRGEIVCVDAARDALAVVDRKLAARPRDLRLRLVQEDLGGLALGRARVRHAPQSIVVLDGMLEYLPERAAAALLSWAHGQLLRGGVVLATTVASSADEVVFEHGLGWPMVRRTQQALEGLLGGGGFGEGRVYAAGGAGLVGVGRA